MNMVNHAKEEFRAAGWVDENGNYHDEAQKWVCEGILDVMKVFSDQGHSGFSAAYTINLLERLLRFQPIAPLTGEDREWNYVADDLWQNKRASNVFKNAKGEVWNIDGIVFWEWHRDPETGEVFKSTFTSKDSSIPVEFPYTIPSEPEYVFRPTEEFPNEDLRYEKSE